MGLDMVVHVYDRSTWDAVEGELGNLGHPQLLSNLKAIPKPYLHETVSKQRKKTEKQNQTKKERNQAEVDVNLLFSN